MTLVIPTAGQRLDLLKRTLDALAVCRKPACYGGAIVIENGGRHGVEAVVAQCPAALNARYLFHPQGNKSAALNAVLEQLGDGLIVFFDDDVRMDADLLEQYARAAADVEGGCYFGGPTEVDYETPPPAWLRTFLPNSARGWSPKAGEDPDRLRFLGFNWAAFAADLRAVGGFDPTRGPGAATGSTGQETDMQHRLIAAGLRSVYLPSAKVWHYVPVKRCTPEWALERAYRNGIKTGLMRPSGMNPHWLGRAREWANMGLVYSRYMREAALWSVVGGVSRRPERRFRGQWMRQRFYGMLEGFRRR
ncbi:MAG: glycosyltransferase [Phycisphaeraceae bacterium]